MQVPEDLIARIERHNPALNAIVTLDVEGARRRAQEADAARSQDRIWGPLHGVPITIKDSFETGGLRTVSGYPPFARHVPRDDAPPVARLRQAGAIILGKTNLPPLASGIQSNNPVFGRTPQGLPIGIQVVGRRWQEMALLNVAEQIAALTPGYQPPPGY